MKMVQFAGPPNTEINATYHIKSMLLTTLTARLTVADLTICFGPPFILNTRPN